MLVTVATFNDPLQAHILCGRLKSEGIDCFLADDQIVQANWLYANAVGGVKLRVRDDDVDRAVDLLRVILEDQGTDGTADTAVDDEPPACPNCASANVSFQKYHRRFAFASWLFLGFPIPWRRDRWECKDCGERWR